MFAMQLKDKDLLDYLYYYLGQFTRNYTQTVKRAADNKRRYAALSGSIPPFVVSSPFHGLRVVPCKLT